MISWIKRLSLLPIFFFPSALVILFFFNLGEDLIFNPPYLLLSLNTIFLTGTGIVVAAVSAKSYLKEGSNVMLILGLATSIGGIAALFAGWAAIFSLNYSVAIYNIGILLSGGLQVLSAVITFVAAPPTESTNRKKTIILSYLVVIISLTVITALVVWGFSPTFFTASGPTIERQWVIGTAIAFFVISTVLFGLKYSQSKSSVLLWYMMALALSALGLFAASIFGTPNAAFNWTARIILYIAGLYFLAGLLSAMRTESFEGSETGGISERWAEAFRSDRQQFETLFSKMLNGFAYHRIIVDVSGKPVDYVFLAANEAFERMTGLNRQDVVGKKVSEVLLGIENDPADWIGTYGKVALTGQPVIFENYNNALGKWYSVSAYSPKKGYFVALFEEITKRKKAEEDLRESERRLNRSQEIANLGSWELDLQSNQLTWSDEVYRIFGLKPQQFSATYEAFLKAVHPDDRAAVDAAYSISVREGKNGYTIEHRVVRPDGELRNVQEKCTNILDKSGKIVRSIGMVQDITERKKAEEAVARQAELIDLSPDAIIIRKLDGPITFWSKGAEKLYGWTKEEAIGQDVNLLLKTQLPQSLKEIQNELKIKGKWSGEIIHICKNASKLVVQSYWLGKFGSDGKIMEVLESNVDVTERIQMQLKLEESAVRLEEYANQMEELANQRAAQLKDSERLAAIGATAGMVGHDIRNPLQAITGDIYLAKTELASIPEGEEKKNIQESLTEIEKNIDYINKIVADLQDFARPLKPNIEETDLKLIIDDLLSKNGLPENVKVSVKVETGKIVADSTFINRILYNLVNNAVQAMPTGGKLTIRTYKEANDTLISVKDTGVGIPETVKGKLFTPMFTTKSKGQGFGLAVIKRMTEALGGTVTFESQEGKGTTFTVRLPPQRSKR
jgi:PAS domain S-box-containing protein